MPKPVSVMGLPIAPVTMRETLDLVSHFVNQNDPTFFITANLHYAMLTEKDPELREVNEKAAFLVADGMPLVWASRKKNQPLPERVTGADLIFRLAEEAALKGWRVFFLGGKPGVAELAVKNLSARYPGLTVAGIEVPPFRVQTQDEEEAMFERIHATKPDLLIGAFSMPNGEKWLAKNYQKLGVPVSVQLGAALDFAAGNVSRAPKWIQRSGMEWAYRFAIEPKRLGGRYFKNARYLARQLLNSK
ncbi:MAG: WecB/TagA/CpsF family glycosyltransferase [Gemmataceae bacterium]